MTVNPDKKLTKISLRFKDIDPETARVKQYELGKELGVWRIFLNGYAKSGFVVFDEELLSKDELLKALEEFGPEVTAVERLTVDELIERSMSWNNVMKVAKA